MNFFDKVNLCYIINKKGEVLLQYKKRGFGQDKWNGPGGKVDVGETAEESAIREVKEETGLIIKNPKKTAELEFIYDGKEVWHRYCDVFVCYEFAGEPKDKGEGELKWFKKEEIPLDKMWEDDKYWLIDVLNGKYVKMRFYFDKDEKLTNYEKIKCLGL